VRRTNPVGGTLSRAFIRCTHFQNPRFDRHAEMAKQSPNWRYRELDAPHHAAFTAPEKVAEVLLELGS
jgi:hypothetical protein